jgi:GNAT superfamily N-acetyltransferase
VPKWIIERLAEHHDRREFDCGQPSLSEWIRQYASQNEKRDLSRTYVAVRPGSFRVFGYYSLASCQIRYTDLPARRAKKLPRSQAIPAALIGRLAVDQAIQGQGLGAILLSDALGRTVRLAEQIATHAIVVDAIDEQARGFYLKHGFEELLDDPLHLFIPMNIVRQLGIVLPTE